jgi:[ribosomal protein S5]-alanine N-acetyltransferase
VVIRTERLDLEPVELSEAHRALKGERHAEWAADYPTEGDLVIARLMADSPNVCNGTYVPYKIIVRAAHRVIGGCGFLGSPDDAGRVEIGYGVAPSQRRMGFATEAVKGLVSQAWQDRVVQGVFALTDSDNLPSQRVLVGAGFEKIGPVEDRLRWEIRRESDPQILTQTHGEQPTRR